MTKMKAMGFSSEGRHRFRQWFQEVTHRAITDAEVDERFDICDMDYEESLGVIVVGDSETVSGEPTSFEVFASDVVFDDEADVMSADVGEKLNELMVEELAAYAKMRIITAINDGTLPKKPTMDDVFDCINVSFLVDAKGFCPIENLAEYEKAMDIVEEWLPRTVGAARTVTIEAPDLNELARLKGWLMCFEPDASEADDADYEEKVLDGEKANRVVELLERIERAMGVA